MNKSQTKLKKLCYITTSPLFFTFFMQSTINTILEHDFELHLVCSDKLDTSTINTSPKLYLHQLRIERHIAPLQDLISLIRLSLLLNKIKPSITHSFTPKAGLITALAAFICHVPKRLHTFTGQAWATQHGLIKRICIECDRLINKLNTQSYADSKSQVELFKEQIIGLKKEIAVLGHGSITGVDPEIYDSNRWSLTEKQELRAELKIPSNAFVINFTGRLKVEKGIIELLEAFQKLSDENNNLYWLVVGPLEEGTHGLPTNIYAALQTHSKIRHVGYTRTPERFYAISDLLCLPSYREGFGNVVIEAAMMKLTAVGTQTVGLKDSIIDGETGLLVPIKDSTLLGNALRKVIFDDNLRNKLASNAYKRALSCFSQKMINQLILEQYQ